MAGDARLSWLDGRFVAADEGRPEARAPGTFTTLRCEGGRLAFLGAHLERLARDARALALPWPPPWDPLAALRAAAARLGAGTWAVRIAWMPPELEVAARPAPPPPDVRIGRLAAAGAVELPRPQGVKTLARAGYDRLHRATRDAGAFEALVLDGEGRLVEGTVTNVLAALDGRLATPPLARGALPGVARAALLADLARAPLRDARGRTWRAEERDIDAAEVLCASEVLVTNSVAGVVALSALETPDGRRRALPGAAGALARALAGRFQALEAAARRSLLAPALRGGPGSPSALPAACNRGPDGRDCSEPPSPALDP